MLRASEISEHVSSGIITIPPLITMEKICGITTEPKPFFDPEELSCSGCAALPATLCMAIPTSRKSSSEMCSATVS